MAEAKVLSGHCNGCANRCPITAMQCARGLMLMGLGKLDEQVEKKPEDDLGTMLRACSNKLFVGGEGEAFFDKLTDEEKENLRNCFKKLLGK